MPISCSVSITTEFFTMALITGLSNKKYFELLANGGELKVIISKEDYEAFCDFELQPTEESATLTRHLGDPWEIVVMTISTLGGSIQYNKLSEDTFEAIIILDQSNTFSVLSNTNR